MKYKITEIFISNRWKMAKSGRPNSWTILGIKLDFWDYNRYHYVICLFGIELWICLIRMYNNEM